MGFKDIIAKAQTQTQNGGDFFLPDVMGTMEIVKITHNSGFKGDTVALEAKVLTCEPKTAGGKCHTPGSIVKKLYLLTKYPEVAPSQLKTDLLCILGEKPEDVSAKDMDVLLTAVFEDVASPHYALKGVKAKFDTKLKDRSDKGKAAITVVYFKPLE